MSVMNEDDDDLTFDWYDRGRDDFVPATRTETPGALHVCADRLMCCACEHRNVVDNDPRAEDPIETFFGWG